MGLLRLNLPHCRWDYKIVGVYIIRFDSGEFYIGASGHLKSRASQWVSMFESPMKPYKQYAVGNSLIEKIRSGVNASLEILELCNMDDVRERELEYLDKYKDDPLMLSDANCSWKAVLQYKKDGLFIKKHMSIKAAAKYADTTVGRIQDVLNGHRTAHKGMVFIYESEYQQRRKTIIKARYTYSIPRKTKATKVGQFDINGKLINMFSTYVEAAKSVGGDPTNIKRVIGGRQNTASGYVWKLIE